MSAAPQPGGVISLLSSAWGDLQNLEMTEPDILSIKVDILDVGI